jgi:hypothetical protein
MNWGLQATTITSTAWQIIWLVSSQSPIVVGLRYEALLPSNGYLDMFPQQQT